MKRKAKEAEEMLFQQQNELHAAIMASRLEYEKILEKEKRAEKQG
jgi:hypothetical protein